MENQTKLYPSYMGEFYAANPVKFEKRKNNVKPMLYYGLAVVAVIIVIFPGFIPVAGWLVRTVGVIAVLICLLAAYLSNFDYYNSESGGKIKEVGLKKFKRDADRRRAIIVVTTNPEIADAMEHSVELD